MKKKNLQPKQTAPVERDNTTQHRTSAQGIIALFMIGIYPLAGDDAD